MSPIATPQDALKEPLRALGQWLQSWWRIVYLGAQLLALALSPSSYGLGDRRELARHLYRGTAPSLLWFSVLTTLISLVLIRIVLVTSVSYGLTQYALEMVVRVLVLELIPLTAALFAALRCTIPFAMEVSALRAQGRWDALQRDGLDPLRHEVLPRVLAGVFCALMLAAVSCVVTLTLAYLGVYGFTLAGVPAYTHTVGQVFGPGISLVFGLKVLFLAVTVALVPLASVLLPMPTRAAATSAELRGLVRMFFLILVIEAVSLVGNYY